MRQKIMKILIFKLLPHILRVYERKYIQNPHSVSVYYSQGALKWEADIKKRKAIKLLFLSASRYKSLNISQILKV